MRKGPGFTYRYANGFRLFMDYASYSRPWLKHGSAVDVAVEKRLPALTRYDPWDFSKAAGDTLSRVNADPRNHFGKHVLRRFENDD